MQAAVQGHNGVIPLDSRKASGIAFILPTSCVFCKIIRRCFILKSTKKSFILSVASLTLCVLMLIGTTFAWFTDSVTSGNNKITAGNLDIELYHSNGTVADEAVTDSTKLFDVDFWEPGAVSYENFKVENIGTLDLKYDLALVFGEFNTVKDETYSLKDMLKAAVIDGTFSGSREDAEKLEFKPLEDIVAENETLSVGASKEFAVVIYWEPNANEVDDLYNLNNGKLSSDGEPLYIELGISLDATQLAAETVSSSN